MANAALLKSHRDIIVKLTIFVAVIVVTSALAFYLSGMKEEMDKKYVWIKNDIGDLNRKLEGLNQKTVEFSEAVKAWELLPKEAKALPGLRINDAKDILEKLQKKYRLTGVKTSFSKPAEITGEYKTDTVMLVSSVISMSFNAKSDNYIYGFIDDLGREMPGYVQIRSFSINNPAKISKDILKRIAQGEDVSVVSASIEFYWHDLKYKGKSTNSENPQGEGMQP